MRALGALEGKKMKGFKEIKKRRGMFMSQRERKKNFDFSSSKNSLWGTKWNGCGKSKRP